MTITYPGCEGIHMMGDNALENITSDHLGEDAASVRSYFPGGAILIKDSKGFKAADKMTKFRSAEPPGASPKKDERTPQSRAESQRLRTHTSRFLEMVISDVPCGGSVVARSWNDSTSSRTQGSGDLEVSFQVF